MFATEPTIVRLPPNVVESASTFHIKAGSANRAIQFPATNTKGTFEKTFDPTTENQVRFHACAGALDPKIGCNREQIASGRPVSLKPPTTMNGTTKKRSRCQSTSLSTT